MYLQNIDSMRNWLEWWMCQQIYSHRKVVGTVHVVWKEMAYLGQQLSVILAQNTLSYSAGWMSSPCQYFMFLAVRCYIFVLQSVAIVFVVIFVHTTTALILLYLIMSVCQPPYLACQVCIAMCCSNIFVLLYLNSCNNQYSITVLSLLLAVSGFVCSWPSSNSVSSDHISQLQSVQTFLQNNPCDQQTSVGVGHIYVLHAGYMA